MSRISGRTAIGAGFGLIRREPLAFLAWSGAYLALGALPALGIMALAAPLYGQMLSGNFDPSSPVAMQAQAQSMMLQPVSYLSSILLYALIGGAVFRAVLRPEDRRFLYLRLSGREGWLGLSLVVLAVMAIIGLLVLVLPVAIVGAVFAVVAGGGPAGVVIAPLLMLVVIGVTLWAMLRLSMGPVMSFAERNFRLFESWGVTRGHAGKMFLVGLAVALIGFAVQLVMIVALTLLANSLVPLATIGQAFAEDPAATMGRLAPLAVIGGSAAVLLGTAVFVLYAAAWASMYRQLVPDHAEVF